MSGDLINELRKKGETDAADEIEQLRHDNGEHQYVRAYFITAMNGLLNSPKGVVPDSAQLFYDSNLGIFK